jgi:hypothetical protein
MRNRFLDERTARDIDILSRIYFAAWGGRNHRWFWTMSGPCKSSIGITTHPWMRGRCASSSAELTSEPSRFSPGLP